MPLGANPDATTFGVADFEHIIGSQPCFANIYIIYIVIVIISFSSFIFPLLPYFFQCPLQNGTFWTRFPYKGTAEGNVHWIRSCWEEFYWRRNLEAPLNKGQPVLGRLLMIPSRVQWLSLYPICN